MRTKKILLLLIIVGVIGLIVTHQKKSAPHTANATPSLSPSPTTGASTVPSPSIEGHHCLDESVFSDITGQSYSLVRENLLIEVNTLECEYDADNMVNNLTPSIHYTVQMTPDDKQWQATRNEITAKASYRRIDGKDYIAADVNPVVEIAQATFYAYKDQKNIELNYTPIDSEVGVLLDKGVQLTDAVFDKN